MSALFNSLAITGSGMNVYKTWIDATADNVANISTVRPTNEVAFQERFVIAQANQYDRGQIGQGASVQGVAFGDPEGRLVYDPNHALADEDGMVRLPDMDMGEQMTNLIIAQRAYQANVTVFERARDAYLRGLEIGR
ncbi:MAG: flagellar basal-body rod protein FlgC [Acidimicrobiia bacterium]|nr:flagellar basal-body rod protein FlgC [Acidimicrobiia bacterium]